MKNLKKFLCYFTPFEWIFWGLSTLGIVLSFLLFRNENYHYLAVSLIGTTGLLFVAKGNPIGQAILIVFAVFYGIISYSVRYYGEMITFLGMSLPSAAFALLSWLLHPHAGNRAEVQINRLKAGEYLLSALCVGVLCVGFYFLLQYFRTDRLLLSTFSVYTSMYACYLAIRRSRFFPLAYIANDVVIVGLWVFKSVQDLSFVPMAICFFAFFLFDAYSFFNWSRIAKRQNKTAA